MALSLGVLDLIRRYAGSGGVQLSKFIPAIAKLIVDPNEAVREQAMITVSEIYRHVGERLRTDLARVEGLAFAVELLILAGIPSARLQALFERLDAVAHTGGVSRLSSFAQCR